MIVFFLMCRQISKYIFPSTLNTRDMHSVWRTFRDDVGAQIDELRAACVAIVTIESEVAIGDSFAPPDIAAHVFIEYGSVF